MRLSHLSRALTIGILLTAAPVVAQSPFRWWKSEEFKKDLGLTADQSARIDGVYLAALPRLRQGKEQLDRKEDELSRLIETNADEALVAKQVDKVEVVRSALNKERTLMLLRMRQVLSPEQRIKLQALHNHWQRDHRRPDRQGKQ